MGAVGGSSASASSGNSGRGSGEEIVFFFQIFQGFSGLWREISENGARNSAQNFHAKPLGIVVWPGEPFLEKS